MGGRRGAAAVMAAVAAATIGISAAWACTGQPLMHLATDAVGEARSPAKVEVPANQAVSGPVTLRWNATDGPVLATADVAAGKAATLEATIPDAAPGVYYLVLNTSGGVARTAFQIVGHGATASDNPWAVERPRVDDAPVGALTSGVAVLAVGLVAMSALTLAVVARRRRATTTA